MKTYLIILIGMILLVGGVTAGITLNKDVSVDKTLKDYKDLKNFSYSYFQRELDNGLLEVCVVKDDKINDPYSLSCLVVNDGQQDSVISEIISYDLNQTKQKEGKTKGTKDGGGSISLNSK